MKIGDKALTVIVAITDERALEMWFSQNSLKLMRCIEY